jgi:hypothetical protein
MFNSESAAQHHNQKGSDLEGFETFLSQLSLDDIVKPEFVAKI